MKITFKLDLDAADASTYWLSDKHSLHVDEAIARLEQAHESVIKLQVYQRVKDIIDEMLLNEARKRCWMLEVEPRIDEVTEIMRRKKI